MKKNKNKIYITLSIFIVAAMLLIVLCVWPLFKEIEKNSKEFVSAKNNTAALTLQKNETDAFKKNYESYKPNLEKIDQLFIDSTNPVDFIKFLEESSYNSQITSQISLSDSSNIQKQENQSYIVFRLSSSGSFIKMINFIKKIEEGPYLVEIDTLTMQNLDEAVNTSVVKALPIVYTNYSGRQIDASFVIKAFTKK